MAQNEPLNGKEIEVTCPECEHQFLIEIAPHVTNQGKGILECGLTPDQKMVHVQFFNPDWFVQFSPAQAKAFAHNLVDKANQCRRANKG